MSDVIVRIQGQAAAKEAADDEQHRKDDPGSHVLHSFGAIERLHEG